MHTHDITRDSLGANNFYALSSGIIARISHLYGCRKGSKKTSDDYSRALVVEIFTGHQSRAESRLKVFRRFMKHIDFHAKVRFSRVENGLLLLPTTFAEE